MPGFDLSQLPVYLGSGSRIVALPPFDGTFEWYGNVGKLGEADGVPGWLVTLHTFTGPWDTWEQHPVGHELVVCVSGRMTLHQDRDGEVTTVVLDAGQAAVNEPGVWHTADVEGTAVGLFVTAGDGTEVRAR
jgi:hypothetical protein